MNRPLWRRLARDPRALVGAGVLVLLAAAAVVGPWLSPYGVYEEHLGVRNQGPSWAHPFGTGALGEDMLTQVLQAGRVSLGVGLATALVATLVGAGLGLFAGWRGGAADAALSRGTDLVLVVPALVVMMVLAVSFDRLGPVEIVVILALMSWPPVFRLARASARGTRVRPYVEVARMAGADTAHIVRRHLLPAAAPEVITAGALVVGGAILAESALSYLSLGLAADSGPSWGLLLVGAESLIEDRPWRVIFPAAFIVAAVVAVGLLAESLHDALRAATHPTGVRGR